MKDRNIVTMLDESVRTIGVSFDTSNKMYTFATRENFAVGDYAIVQSQYKQSGLDIVKVKRVDDVPDISPDCSYEIRYIVQRIAMEDFEQHEQEMERATETVRAHRIKTQREQMNASLRGVLGLPEGVDPSSVINEKKDE